MIIPKGKKGQLLLYGLIAGIVAALIMAYIDNAKTKKEFDVIGTSSLSLIDSSIEAEKALLYIDQSAKYSVYQAIYDLAKNGGCVNGEKYSGYTLWDLDNSNQCPPDLDYSKNNFLNFFSSNLNNRLSKYEHLELPLNNFNLNFGDKHLAGIAVEPFKIPIKKGLEKESTGLYSINSSFKLNIDYDFSDYDELRARIEQLVDICKDKNPHLCINENVFNIFNKGNFKLDVCGIGQDSPVFSGQRIISGTRYVVYAFCVKNVLNSQYYAFDNGEVALRDIVYKFALEFEELPCDDDGYDITKCREYPCDEYFYCTRNVIGNIDICFCPAPPSYPCYGTCPLCECTPWASTGCGGGCSEDEMAYVRECRHKTCGLEETKCEYDCVCDAPCYCDPCCFNYGTECGPCGWDPCPPPPEPEEPENGNGE